MLLLLGLLALAGSSRPRPRPRQREQTQESIMMDDDQLLYAATRCATPRCARCSARRRHVRSTVLWNVVAQDAKTASAARSARSSSADDPPTLPQRQLGPLRPPRPRRAALGIGMLLRRHRPRPALGATGKAPSKYKEYQRTWKPKRGVLSVRQGARQALLRHLQGRERRRRAPARDRWSLWNEPNQPGWLTPQCQGTDPWSPIITAACARRAERSSHRPQGRPRPDG